MIDDLCRHGLWSEEICERCEEVLPLERELAEARAALREVPKPTDRPLVHKVWRFTHKAAIDAAKERK